MPVVDSLLAEAVSSVTKSTNAQEEITGRIERLRKRLSEGVFKVAVLGQFKRGKSTLLNALLEMQLLPTGVTQSRQFRRSSNMRLKAQRQ
jgi:GTPase SAR1 family protein